MRTVITVAIFLFLVIIMSFIIGIMKYKITSEITPDLWDIAFLLAMINLLAIFMYILHGEQ